MESLDQHCIVDSFLSILCVMYTIDNLGVSKHLDDPSQSPGENPLVSSVAVV